MNLKDKNVLITGADGFVGSYLAEELINNGSNVHGLIQRGTGDLYSKNLTDHGIENSLNLIEGDLTDITSLANALDISEPDYVFHLAAQSFVPASFREPAWNTDDKLYWYSKPFRCYTCERFQS